MRDRSSHFFTSGYPGEGIHQNDNIDEFLAGINEAKSLDEDDREHSASVTHFGDTTNYVRALSACANWPSLTTLTVMCQNVPRIQDINNAVSTLIEVLHSNPQLQQINLIHLDLACNHEIERLFDAIRQHPGLQNVYLNGSMFANEATQVACLTALAEKKNLINLSCVFDWHGDAGLSQLVRMNNTVQSIEHIPYHYAEKLVDDLTANPNSHLKYVGMSAHGEFRKRIAGDTVMKLIQILNERHRSDFSFSNDYQSGVAFTDMQQANELLKIARLHLQCVINLEVLSIGDQNRYTDKGDYNPPVKLYQDKLNAISARNRAVVKAYVDQYNYGSECANFVMTEFVYLHHQQKYQEKFGEPAMAVYPVSLKARAWFQLFKQHPEQLLAADESVMHQSNEKILKDKSRYGLE